MIPTLAVIALLLTATSLAKGRPSLAYRASSQIVALWTCQTQLGIPRTPAKPSPWAIGHHNASWKAAYLGKWILRRKACLARLHARAEALRTGNYRSLPDGDLYALADQAVASGAIYSERWGDASPTLKSLCYEAVTRAFARFGNERWARFIVNRESGCNPGAVNTTYSSWREQAKCLSQMIPRYHAWVDYPRCLRDLRYAVQVFVRLSRGGKSTGPWS